MSNMGRSGAKDSIEYHGTAIDKEKNRIRCKHCGKEVPGFNRLKHHLGGVGTDVVSCVHVPTDVKKRMKDSLLEKKKDRLVREVGDLYHPDLPMKRNIVSSSSESRRCQPKLTHPTSSTNEHLTSGTPILGSSNENGSVSHAVQNRPSALEKGKNVMDPTQGGFNGTRGVFIMKEENIDVIIKEEMKDEPSTVAAKSVGRFFYEANIDPAAVRMHSFQKMLDAAIKCGTGFKVPKYNELRGWILQEDIKEVQRQVEEVKRYWGQAGCSILLDISTDQSGKSSIGFLVDCPQGTVFLRSVDASHAIRDTRALVSLLSAVIEEVGVSNVVQVITHDASYYLKSAGKRIVNKYKTIFWTVCADHCINLILERLESLVHVKMVLDEAKTITRFLYNDELLQELMRKHIVGRELVRTSMLKSVVPFITLENMVSERENLVRLFTSEAWRTSPWSTKTKGEIVCDLVMDDSFWAAAIDILKITNPIISVLRMINESDTSPMGFLYDAMDMAKVEIGKNLGGEKDSYMPYWGIIDEVWNNYLHSHLHSAAYYLNPILFYSDNFHMDSEVTNGTLKCILQMSENRRQEQLITTQLESYRTAIGGFSEEMAVIDISEVPPGALCLQGKQWHDSRTCISVSPYNGGKVYCSNRGIQKVFVTDDILEELWLKHEPYVLLCDSQSVIHLDKNPVFPTFWWSLHGWHCPELQNFATRILQQTCTTSSRFKLREGVSPQLLAKPRNSIEQQRFADMEFVRNNLRLLQPQSNRRDQRDDISLGDVNATNDWIMEDI